MDTYLKISLDMTGAVSTVPHTFEIFPCLEPFESLDKGSGITTKSFSSPVHVASRFCINNF